MKSIDQAILAHFSPGFGGTKVPDWLKRWLQAGLGGVTLFSSNTPSLEQTVDLVQEIRSYSPKVIISIDEEGGDVTRLFVKDGSPFPSPALLGRCDDLSLTYNSYLELGQVLHEVGVDISFAPVVDVATADKNPIIGVRSFGNDFRKVAFQSAAAVRGFHDAGVCACIKHFPGHGGVEEDSHHHLPTLNGTLADLEKSHLYPFIESIAAGAQAIMVGHIILPSIDQENPASCSRLVISDYLKKKLGFTGLVVTDALDMGALGGPKKIADSATRAMKAGADLLCFSGLYDQSEFVSSSFEAIKNAITDGSINLEGLLSNGERLSDWRPDAPTAMHRSTELSRVALAGRMEVSGDVSIHEPLVHLVEMSADPTIAAGYVAWGMRRSLTHRGVKVKLETSDVMLKDGKNSQMIVAFRDAYRDKKLLQSLNRLEQLYPDAIFIDMGWPTREFAPRNYIRTFGSGSINSDVAVDILLSPDHQPA